MEALEGRVAFVTGGARGIGLAIALSAARRGMRVAIADIDTEALATAAEALSPLTEVGSYVLDVRDRNAFSRVADAAEQDLGPVSLLVNNAGIVDSVSPAKMNYTSWDWVLAINLNGVYNGIQTFVPRMIDRGGDAHVVNTSSMAGLITSSSGFLYHTSKFAVVGLSESLRSELAHHRIGVSVLCPGEVATGIVDNALRMRPTDAPSHSQRVSAVLAAANASLREHGVPPEVAGENVLNAVVADDPYIFTDDRYIDAVRERMATLIEAMTTPAASSPSS